MLRSESLTLNTHPLTLVNPESTVIYAQKQRMPDLWPLPYVAAEPVAPHH